VAGRSKADFLGFFVRAGRLKSEPRRGWILKLAMENPESVADHSYRVALMAMVYCDVRGLDGGKAMKMALLHDLPEAVVGDSIPGERAPREKRKLEAAAMRSILKDLPRDIAREYASLWKEYETGASPEARLVRDLDKVELAIQAGEYRRDDPANDVEEFMRTARRRVTDPELAGVIDSLA
jgi:putative hydrolases of HD superfamily